MKIEANDLEVQEIFPLGYFRIPRFQRPYSWGDDEVSNFWNDVIKDENDQYFIGSMVVYQEKKPYFGIVDGQQRLSTITLILAAIRNAFIALDEENLARGIHQFIERPNIDNLDEFVLNSETSYPYLQNHIQSFNGYQVECSVGSEEQNLKNAFEYITKSLDNELPSEVSGDAVQLSMFTDTKSAAVKKLKEIRDRVLSLKLVFIQLDNEDDAYLIFETLNARGRDLTTSDLVKNHLMKKMQSNNEKNDTAKIVWNQILQRFDDAGFQHGMDTYLAHYWLSEKKYITDKALFADLKNEASDSQSAAKLLKQIEINSEYYLSIIAPKSYHWNSEQQKVKQSLEALLLFGVQQQRSMVLSLIRAYREKRISLKMFSTALEKIEYFHFVFNAVTSQRSSGAIATNYSKHAIQLSKAEDHSAIQSTLTSLSRSLKAKLPSFNEFQASFIQLSYTSRRTKNKTVIHYALKKLLGENPSGLTVDYDSMSIEHLLPEDHIDSDEKDVLVGNIGNLILIDKKTNNEELKNLNFESKKKILLEKQYPLDEIILSVDEWSTEKIEARAVYLAKKLYDEKILG